MKKIVYVGNKELKGDNISQTGLVWMRGQVHQVDDDVKAAKLLEHTLIWQDATGKSAAEVEQMLLPPIQAVAPEPIVRVVPDDDPLLDAFVIPVPGEVLKQLHAKTLIPVFMSETDADGFAAWKKMEAETAPKNTGPKAQDKATKAGLESKPRAA